MTTGTRFLDPQVLARIDNLELLARTVVDGFINGLHHSPYFGLSTDFAEHRPYMPGDDIRRIDWRVYGRTDRFYVKEFEADTNANFSVLLDISRSMAFGSAGITKLDYARYLAACVAYMSRRQRDRVGIVTFDADVRAYVPTSAKHLDLVLHTIDRIEATAAGAFAGPMAKVAESIRRRSILLILSDFYEDPEVISRELARLRDKGHDLIAFHVLDPAELAFPFDEASPFEDLETGERLPVVPESQREEYRRLMAGHIERVGNLLIRNQIDYMLLETSKPLDFALVEYLSRRQALARIR